MICQHIQNAQLAPPAASTLVYKDECTQCFDDHDLAEGIDVCLTCFNGGCPGLEPPHNHAQLHSIKSGHQLSLNIRRTLRQSAEDSPRPAKLTKLEIKEDDDKDKYEYHTFVRCWECSGQKVDTTENAEATVNAVMSAVEARKRDQVKAWSEEVSTCQHFSSDIAQQPHENFSLEHLNKCAGCDKSENLWLCLSCGNVGCGRRQYDGSGGNNHAIEHFNATGHQVSVKLGTISADGTADAYCYVCDDNRYDPQLSEHLQVFGIKVYSQQKTDKSMAELQLEHNLKFDFSMVTADGAKLEPVTGPGLTGLKNLGNSCYMASILQCVFAIDGFRDRYFPSAMDHFISCTQPSPAQCVLCQLHKMAYGLWSGRYSNMEVGNQGNETQQVGIAPHMFKAAIAQSHHEFGSMRQQDAVEFLQHLNKQVDLVEQSSREASPTQAYDFEMEERIQCTKCLGVRYNKQKESMISLPVIKRPIQQEDGKAYEPVSLAECLDVMVAEETVEGFSCSRCKEPTTVTKSTKFATFPKVLVVALLRFDITQLGPEKLDIPVQVPANQSIDFAKYQFKGGIQPGETPLPEDAQPSQPAVDEEAAVQLESMGFPRVRCVKALKNTGNTGAEAAMNWILEHMDDPDIDVPEQEPAAAEADPAAVEQLVAMGFPTEQAQRALKKTDGNTERALDRLLSGADIGDDDDDETSSSQQQAAGSATDTALELTGFVSHKGTSVHCGHYVATVRHSDEWFFFNDSKVVKQPTPDASESYVLLFTRK